MVSQRFVGKRVIITGALGGIGFATAERFAAEGARLMVVDLLSDDGSAAEKLRSAGAPRVVTAVCDIAQENQVASAVERTLGELGGLDVIVNVAGMMCYKAIAELTGADWRRMLDVNFLGAAFFTTQALRHMTSGGAIVNVASIHARQTASLVAPYAAAKAALESLTRSAAIEGRERNIRVNAVLPGAVDTAMLKASPLIQSGAEKIDPAEVGSPSDIAATVAFLASDDARFVTGASMLVDGGRLAKL